MTFANNRCYDYLVDAIYYYTYKIVCSADLAIDGEVDNFETSVKYFTVDQGNEVCTLFGAQIELFHIILSALY